MVESFFPHSYSQVFKALSRRLQEPAPGRIQVLTGPRQVGKTHLLLRLQSRRKRSTLYAAADTPEAALPGFWETLWNQAMERARAQGSAVLMIDEIFYLPGWSRLLKASFDQVLREKIPLHVVVTGSSSLRLGSGARESLAGRFEKLQLSHWPPSELARFFGMAKEKALEEAIRFGTYPGAVGLREDPSRRRRYILDAIVEPAVGRDILATEVIRKPGLLRQLFALAAGHPAEIVSLQKLRGSLADRGALETLAHYLKVLEDAYLTAALPKWSPRPIRRRAAPPKLVVLNQGILWAMQDLQPPTQGKDPERWGRWVENACLAHAWNAGQTLFYWREAPLEVDLVMEGSWGKWALEVKTGSYKAGDLSGLLEFCKRNPAFRPLALVDKGREGPALSAGIRALPWEDFLLSGLSKIRR